MIILSSDDTIEENVISSMISLLNQSRIGSKETKDEYLTKLL